MLASFIHKRDSKVSGLGLFAAQFIPEGTTVWESDSSGTELMQEDLDSLAPEKRDLVYQRGRHLVLENDDSQYMNHSCDPNTWWVDDRMMAAIRDIEAGEEITYDYATSEANHWWRSRWSCRCGSSNCRVTITGLDCLCRDFQKRYDGHLPTWVEDFIAKHRGARGAVLRGLYAVTDLNRRVWQGVSSLSRRDRG